MTAPRIRIITRGGHHYGMGHLVRSAALAGELTRDCTVDVLYDGDQAAVDFWQARPLRAAHMRDSRRLLADLARQERAAAILVDVYRMAPSLLAKVAQRADRVLVLDDMHFHRAAGANVTVVRPQDPVPGRATRTAAGATLLEGCAYFPLRAEFAAHPAAPSRNGAVCRVGVIMGGIPDARHLDAVLAGLDRVLPPGMEIRVATGLAAAADAPRLAARVRRMHPGPAMADFMAGLDFAVIAGGFTKFECLCLGIPMAMVSLCAHQATLARAYERAGLGLYLGDWRAIVAPAGRRWPARLLRLLDSNIERRALSQRGRALVDGHGAQRLHTHLLDLIRRKK
jgi:spore coat polysaccharide biosynthesis predicted glycosyltransferase SpsG